MTMRTAFRVSNQTYGVLVALYPRDLRLSFAKEMTEVFDQQLQDAWAESGVLGFLRVWLCAFQELICVALPAQLAQPIVVVPTLSLISNSFLFLVILRALSPLAELIRANRP